MKKILMALLLPILLLPMVVKADMEIIKTYYNDNVMVGGEVVVRLFTNTYEKEYNIAVEYDTSLLKIDESNISINPSFYNKVEENKQYDNTLEVTIQNGVINIKTKFGKLEGWSDEPSPEITLRFTALKEGNTEIKFAAKNSYDVIGNAKIKITKNTACEPISQEQPAEQQPTEEPTEKPEDKPTEIPTETEKEMTKEEKKDDRKTKDLLFYISLGLNAVLLVVVILLALKGKKKTAKEEPKVEPTEEKTEEAK